MHEDEYYIGEGGAGFGSHPMNHVCISSDPTVNSDHCQIIYYEDEFCICDLGSVHGTFLSVAKKNIDIGDIFEIGSYEFKVLDINLGGEKPSFMESVFRDEEKIEKSKKRQLTKEEYTSPLELRTQVSFVEFLVSKNGQNIDSYLVFEDGYIGRHHTNALSFPDDREMSRVHCKIIRDYDSLCLVDNNSLKG